MSEQTIGLDQGYVELEAPIQLQPGQNFFDQPPFNQILQQVSDNTGLEIERLRRLLGGICSKSFAMSNLRDLSYGDRLDPDLAAPELREQMSFPKYRLIEGYYVRVFGSKERIRVREGVRQLGQALDDYPYWYHYIAQHIRPGWNYSLDGVYKTHGSSPDVAMDLEPAITYPKWLAAERRIRGKAMLVGIEEIFPQDFAGRSLVLPNLAASKPATHIWRIRKIAETVREKRT